MSQVLLQKKLAHRFIEPHILFPVLTMVLLIVIWASAFELIRVRQQTSLQQAQETARDMAETYHAQLLRALREIELTMAIVAYAQEHEPADTAINLLANRDMLPPPILFSVAVYDGLGHLIASNTSETADLPQHLVEDITRNNHQEQIWISNPQFDEQGQRWLIHFARTTSLPDQTRQFILTVTTDAEFFVSSYDETRLGKDGMLALITDRGRVLVRRSGDIIDIDGPLIAAEVPAPLVAGDGQLVEFAHPFDNINRFYSTQRLFGFPLTLVTGVSVDEHMADAIAIRKWIIGLTSFASIMLGLMMGLLGRYSYQLHRSRLQLMAQQIAHSHKVEYMAFHDGLTGLPNRSLFSRLVYQNILEAKRENHQFAVLFLDLDKFKLINDTLGHEAGDDLLKEVARRIKNSLRESDVVARLGGDEFVALLRRTGSEQEISDLAVKVLHAVCQPYMLQSQETVITVSIGISIYPQDGLDEQTLTRNADIAMYHAKQNGRNQVKLFAQLPPEFRN